MTTTTTRPTTAATALSTMDTTRVLLRVLAPVVAQGPIIRRPAVTAWAARHGWDARAGLVLDDLRRRYGPGPVLLRLPGRHVAILLAAEDVGRMLDASPEPFAAAASEKKAALRHFQPDGVLISTGVTRSRRRVFNEDVLDTGHAMHRLAGDITRVVADEIDRLGDHGTMGWTGFGATHARIVRRIVLGDAARDDRTVTDTLDGLRRRSNWAYALPVASARRQAFQARVADYVTTPSPGSLASLVAATPAEPDVDPAGQIPHWLFAFDALGATTWRSLALLAADPRARSLVDSELTGEPAHRPYLTATILDTVRLWPTTLVLLRETTQPSLWRGRNLPAGTTLVALSSYFHRHSRRGADAHRFAPQPWVDGIADADPALIPFSAGPARCPGRDLVTFTGATVLAAVLDRYDVRLRRPTLDPEHLPMALDHFRVQLDLDRLR
jgi:cytochrome P450